MSQPAKPRNSPRQTSTHQIALAHQTFHNFQLSLTFPVSLSDQLPCGSMGLQGDGVNRPGLGAAGLIRKLDGRIPKRLPEASRMTWTGPTDTDVCCLG